jgi:hypothetical protein
MPARTGRIASQSWRSRFRVRLLHKAVRENAQHARGSARQSRRAGRPCDGPRARDGRDGRFRNPPLEAIQRPRRGFVRQPRVVAAPARCAKPGGGGGTSRGAEVGSCLTSAIHRRVGPAHPHRAGLSLAPRPGIGAETGGYRPVSNGIWASATFQGDPDESRFPSGIER